MVRNGVFILMLVLGQLEFCFGQTPWQIGFTEFTRAGSSMMWQASFKPYVETKSSQPNRSSLEVVIAYDSSKIATPKEHEYADKVASFSMKLPNNNLAILTHWQNVNMPIEAIASPQVRTQHIFILQIGSKLLIRQEYIKVQYETELDITKEDDSDIPSNEFDTLISALESGDRKTIIGSVIVKLANWLVSTKGPIGPEKVKIILTSCRASLGGELMDVSIERFGDNKKLMKIAASSEDEFTLFPSFQIKSVIPYYHKIEEQTGPLPSFAFTKLSREDGSIRLFGAPTETVGEFQFGPLSMRNMRRMELEASYPFEPIAKEPSTSCLILFRTGRAIESYLDRHKLPPPPQIPKDLAITGVIPTVVAHASGAVNPDIGILSFLDAHHIIDLYAFGKDYLKDYPELLQIVERTFFTALENRRWKRYNYNPSLISDDWWSGYDALVTLRHPLLAESLAKKIIAEFEPRINLSSAKVSDEWILDETSFCPHAIAAAAFVRADPVRYTKLIHNSVQHIYKVHTISAAETLSLSSIIEAGQGLKLVADSAINKKDRKLARIMVQALREEAFKRFIRDQETLDLGQKIQIAHLISTKWRPYLNIPFEILSLEKPSDVPPEQRMAPGTFGRDITAEVLEESRLKYDAALQRAISELAKSDMSKEEKVVWAKDFLARWYQHLFREHKGGYLQPYEEGLQDDLERVLQEINKE